VSRHQRQNCGAKALSSSAVRATRQ
jgi:hypothetical protein